MHLLQILRTLVVNAAYQHLEDTAGHHVVKLLALRPSIVEVSDTEYF